MQLRINYKAVRAHSAAAPTLATKHLKIGKWDIVIEAIIGAYYSYDSRMGVNGAKPTPSGDIYWRSKTNGIGFNRYLKELDSFLNHMRETKPLHGPPFINPFGYNIYPDGQEQVFGEKVR
jgi:hypothetical protein